MGRGRSTSLDRSLVSLVVTRVEEKNVNRSPTPCATLDLDSGIDRAIVCISDRVIGHSDIASLHAI